MAMIKPMEIAFDDINHILYNINLDYCHLIGRVMVT